MLTSCAQRLSVRASTTNQDPHLNRICWDYTAMAELRFATVMLRELEYKSLHVQLPALVQTLFKPMFFQDIAAIAHAMLASDCSSNKPAHPANLQHNTHKSSGLEIPDMPTNQAMDAGSFVDSSLPR
eukprot:gnl/MRDRNA2_/MRDRNA2_84803_c0_seq4.p1 gnl/MRDRNA2_/MRDRNA2_84803_c0~~gnl/MRDRNA2_/MRDRNA2_84803_c0_seq4.p1  ORF type:complete len:127 (-),score=17.76 gnl/MRDRNA2_/MRDRNA2_84803_c0_seq4:161-541(-)